MIVRGMVKVETTFRIGVRTLLHSMILDMQGDLMKQAEDVVLQQRQWDHGLEGGQKYLILNLSKVPYINSAGIAILIRLVRSGLKGNFSTFAYGVTPHYEKLFRMVGLTEYMMIYPDEYAILERIAVLEEEQR